MLVDQPVLPLVLVAAVAAVVEHQVVEGIVHRPQVAEVEAPLQQGQVSQLPAHSVVPQGQATTPVVKRIPTTRPFKFSLRKP